MKESLTGNIRYRSDKKGRLILQVERRYDVTMNTSGTIDIETCVDYRDARVEDLDVTLRKEE